MERGKTIIPIDKILQCRTKGGTVKTLQIAGFVTEVPGLKGSDKLWEAKPWPTHHRGHSPPGLQLRPEQPCGQFLVSHHGLCQPIEFCSCLGGCCGLTWPPHVPRGAPCLLMDHTSLTRLFWGLQSPWTEDLQMFPSSRLCDLWASHRIPKSWGWCPE